MERISSYRIAEQSIIYQVIVLGKKLLNGWIIGPLMIAVDVFKRVRRIGAPLFQKLKVRMLLINSN